MSSGKGASILFRLQCVNVTYRYTEAQHNREVDYDDSNVTSNELGCAQWLRHGDSWGSLCSKI